MDLNYTLVGIVWGFLYYAFYTAQVAFLYMIWRELNLIRTGPRQL